MNPDHVNLHKDGWVKVISFKTGWKKIPVEIYGRPGKEANSGEFVVVRKGVLPFRVVAVSPKYECKNLWSKGDVNCSRISEGSVIPGMAYYFYFQIGHFHSRRWGFYGPLPSINVNIVKACGSLEYRKYNLDYMF
jgi:hypothetical protein